MHLSFAPIWLSPNELISNLWFFREVCLFSRGRDDDSKVRNFSYSPWKADISGVNWGYSLAESDSSLAKPKQFWFIADFTVLFRFCIIFEAEADNGELKSFAKVRNLCDPVCMMTLLNVILLLYESVWCFTNQLVILITILSLFQHSDLTSFFRVHTPQSGTLIVSLPDKPLGKCLTCVLRKWG